MVSLAGCGNVPGTGVEKPPVRPAAIPTAAPAEKAETKPKATEPVRQVNEPAKKSDPAKKTRI